MQQKDKKVEGVDFVKIAPLDGSCINVKVILNEYESDEIDFVYIESLKINNQELPINRYITDTSSILINYDNGVCKNDVEIKGVAYNSQKVQKGWLFVAIKGFKTDGHEYIDTAIKNGAIAVVCEDVNAYKKFKDLNKNVLFV